MQQPFREGDLVEVASVTGYVQRLTARTTVLMTLDGNQLQIPNSTVFKSTLRNFTSNPNRRDDFMNEPEPALSKPAAEPETVSTQAQAGLQSEAGDIKEQARRSWTPGENLLTSSSSAEDVGPA